MTAHTPGPWLFRGKSNSVYTAPPPGTVYTYGSIIFGFHDVAEPSDEDLALVLAAPDLLAAAEKIMDLGIAESQLEWPELAHALESLRAAIVKAGGIGQ